MRKLLTGLAVALLCAVAASSASAALHTGSATGPLVVNGTTITFNNSGALTWTSSFFGTTSTCTSATMQLKSSNYAATPVVFDVTGFSLTGCSDGCGPDTFTVTGLPWTGSSLSTTTSPNGTFVLKTPGQNITWDFCQLSCSYGTGTTGWAASLTGGNPARIVFNNNMTNSSCFDTATWKVTFTSAGPLGNGLFTS